VIAVLLGFENDDQRNKHGHFVPRWVLWPRLHAQAKIERFKDPHAGSEQVSLDAVRYVRSTLDFESSYAGHHRQAHRGWKLWDPQRVNSCAVDVSDACRELSLPTGDRPIDAQSYLVGCGGGALPLAVVTSFRCSASASSSVRSCCAFPGATCRTCRLRKSRMMTGCCFIDSSFCASYRHSYPNGTSLSSGSLPNVNQMSGCKRDCSRSANRLTESSEHHEVGVKAHPLQAPNAERSKPVVVLQPAELALDSRPTSVEVTEALAVSRDACAAALRAQYRPFLALNAPLANCDFSERTLSRPSSRTGESRQSRQPGTRRIR
jgi:hypothetical protein